MRLCDARGATVAVAAMAGVVTGAASLPLGLDLAGTAALAVGLALGGELLRRGACAVLASRLTERTEDAAGSGSGPGPP